jgi:MFS transporter, DHA1 family, inner membrane transport protein
VHTHPAPRDLAPARRTAALLALASGGFGLGLTTFVPMGLLPEMAQELSAGLYAHSPSRALAQAGWVVTAYPLGVVVGAPVVALLTARTAPRRVVLGTLVVFVLGALGAASAPNLGIELTARLLAGAAHGAYLSVAGTVAAALLGPRSEAKGYAVVLGGLCTANVVGLPLATALGQYAGWRVAFVAIALVFAVALVAVRVTVPVLPERVQVSVRAELSAFRSRRVWLLALTFAAGFAGVFAVLGYIAPVTTHVAGLGEGAVPWVLAVAGVGMAVGVALGGPAADRDERRTLLLGTGVLTAAVGLFALTAGTPVGLFGSTFLICLGFMYAAPAVQTRLMQVVPGARTMGAAISQSATNAANTAGAALGGVVVGAGLGYLAPAVVALALGATGLVLLLVGQRRPEAVVEPAAA